MKNLKKMRQKAGLTQKELAEKAGVSKRMIEQYEQGIKDINEAGAIRVYYMAKALQCNVQDLLEIEETQQKEAESPQKEAERPQKEPK